MFTAARILSSLIEVLLKDRSLVFIGLLWAIVLTCNTAWLQPPLSAGIRGTQVSLLGPHKESLNSEGSFRIDSPASLVLVGICLGLLIVVGVPRQLPAVGGMIVTTALIAHACLLANQPLLIEQLADEGQQYAQVSNVLTFTTSGNAIVDSEARAHSDGSSLAANRRQLGIGFLGHGIWLIPLGLAIQLSAGEASLRRRIGMVSCSMLLGLAGAVLLCSDRIISEYDWRTSEQQLIAGDAVGARASLAKSIHRMPDLGNLSRTWSLAGRIDYASGVASHRRDFFTARQLLANGQFAAAADVLDTLLASSPDAPCIRNTATEAWTLIGLSRYFTARRQHHDLDNRGKGLHAGAITAWNHALEISPRNIPVQVYTILAEAQSSGNPGQVERHSAAVLAQVSNAALRADLLATLGDVFFEAGRYREARQYYAASRDAYELPKDINFRARTGLVGI